MVHKLKTTPLVPASSDEKVTGRHLSYLCIMSTSDPLGATSSILDEDSVMMNPIHHYSLFK